eukprot:6076294-Pyramimonas_sp.AAC.1
MLRARRVCYPRMLHAAQGVVAGAGGGAELAKRPAVRDLHLEAVVGAQHGQQLHGHQLCAQNGPLRPY